MTRSDRLLLTVSALILVFHAAYLFGALNHWSPFYYAPESHSWSRSAPSGEVAMSYFGWVAFGLVFGGAGGCGVWFLSGFFEKKETVNGLSTAALAITGLVALYVALMGLGLTALAVWR